jgi:cytochrome b involved in lipid metabolism
MTNLGSRDLCNPPLIIRQAARLPQTRQIRGTLSTEPSRHSADPLSSVAVRAEVTGGALFPVVSSGISTDRLSSSSTNHLTSSFFPHSRILLCEFSERFQQRSILPDSSFLPPGLNSITKTNKMADKSFTTNDVSTHKDDANGYWLIVEDGVYDVTSAFIPFPLSPLLSLARARE